MLEAVREPFSGEHFLERRGAEVQRKVSEQPNQRAAVHRPARAVARGPQPHLWRHPKTVERFRAERDPREEVRSLHEGRRFESRLRPPYSRHRAVKGKIERTPADLFLPSRQGETRRPANHDRVVRHQFRRKEVLIPRHVGIEAVRAEIIAQETDGSNFRLHRLAETVGKGRTKGERTDVVHAGDRTEPVEQVRAFPRQPKALPGSTQLPLGTRSLIVHAKVVHVDFGVPAGAGAKLSTAADASDTEVLYPNRQVGAPVYRPVEGLSEDHTLLRRGAELRQEESRTAWLGSDGGCRVGEVEDRQGSQSKQRVPHCHPVAGLDGSP